MCVIAWQRNEQGEETRIMTTANRILVLFGGLALAGCSAGASGFYLPIGQPQQPPRVASAGVTIPSQPVAPPPQAIAGQKPTIAINAPVRRVQDTIVERAKTRGTTVLGANSTGVTLEVPLRQSSEVIVQQCGEHRPGRTLRVYLETLPNGTGTLVGEERFIIDGGTSTCRLSLTADDVQGANRQLADLKQQAEAPRVASSSAPSAPGGLQPINPGQAVRPLR
jgi:hypothetical protein